MKPVFQTRYGDPAGNCTEAALASLLECSLDEVPDLWVLAGSPTEPGGRSAPEAPCWRVALDTWLAERGLAWVDLTGAVTEWWLPEGVNVLAFGPAKANGVAHCVVMRVRWTGRDPSGACTGLELELAHDPHEGWDGIAEIRGLSLLVRR